MSLSFRIKITKITHPAPTINRILICWGRFRHSEGCTTPIRGHARLQPAEFSHISLDDVAKNLVLFAMIFVRSLLFGSRSFLQFDERLSMQAKHRRLLDKLTRAGGVFLFGENFFSSLIAKLTFKLLTSQHRRANFRHIWGTGGQQTLFYRLKQGGADSLLRLCCGCLTLLSIFHIFTDKRVQKSFKLRFFTKLSEFDFFSECFSSGQVRDVCWI